MKPAIHIEWLAFFALISFQLSFAKDWGANDYPNPVIDFQKCGMKTSSYICDPDNILSESDRYRLNHELQQLETRTRQDNHPDFCQKKGVTAGIALARKVKGHNQDGVKAMGEKFKHSWMLDPDCKKSVVLVMAVDDKKLWSARDERMPLRDPEIQEIIAKAAPHFKNKQITQGLLGIVRDIWEKTLSKKPQPAPRPTQRPQPKPQPNIPKPQPVKPVQNVPQNPQQPSQNNYNQNNYGSTSSKSEGLGWKTWLVIILIVIALLSICCCCFVYYQCKHMLCGCCEDGGSSHRGGGSSQNVYHHHYHHDKGDGHHTSGGRTSNTVVNEQNTNLISNEKNDEFYPDVNERSNGVGISWGDADDDKDNDNQDTNDDNQDTNDGNQDTGDDTNDKGNDEGNNDTSNDNQDNYYPDVNEKSEGTGMSW